MQPRGRVTQGGQPVAGVRLRLHDRMSGSRDAVSQADGSFTLVTVPFGEVTLRSSTHDIVAPTKLEVRRSGQQDTLTVEVTPKARIRGRVTRRGVAVPYVWVKLDRKDWAKTAKDGSYAFAGLEPGEHSLGVSSTRGSRVAADMDRYVKVSLAKGETKEGVTLELDIAGRISGIVVDQEGNPVPSAYVSWDNKKLRRGSYAVTAEDGSFICRALKGGVSYRPVVFPTTDRIKQLNLTADTRRSVRLADNEAVVEGVRLVVRRERPLSIAGTVLGASGSPIVDARVFLREPNKHGRTASFAVSDSDGRFRIDSTAPGNHSIHVRAPDGSRGMFKVEAGTTDAVLKVASPGRIEGELVGYSHKPYVIVFPHPDPPYDSHIWARVEGDGRNAPFRFSTTGLAPGRYSVTATSPSNGDAKIIEVKSGEATQVTLRSRGGGRVDGQVFEHRSRKPIAGASCRYKMRVGGWFTAASSGNIPRSRTDKDGRFVLEQVPAGDIYIECWDRSARYELGGAALKLSPGQRAKANIIMANRDHSAADRLGLRTDRRAIGALITSVTRGGSGARAGLIAGVRIVAVGAVKVDGLHPLSALAVIAGMARTSERQLTVKRASALLTVTLPKTIQ